jgi:hypothetical protein
MKKAKPAMVKESRVMEETDYFYEKVGKALAEKNPHLDTASSDFVGAVRKEMIAQGIEPNRARGILLMDEDFISDVADSYGHYCELVDTHQPLPAEIDLNEIARLAGLPVRETEVYDEVNHEEVEDNMDEGNAFTGKLASTPKGEEFDLDGNTFKDTSSLEEDDMAEGNEFSGALAKAKAAGAKEFEVDGKKYTVKEDINVNITANGQEDALNLFRKLAGMEEVAAQPVAQVVELPQDAESAIAQGIVEPVEVEVDEERDIEYTNTPNEKIGGLATAIPSGNGEDRAKKMYRKEYPGDNPMAVKEEALWKSYEAMINDVKE